MSKVHVLPLEVKQQRLCATDTQKIAEFDYML